MAEEISKTKILDRIKLHYNLKGNSELADFLGVKKSTISNWYARNTIDFDLIFLKCEDMDFKYLISGNERFKSTSIGNLSIDEQKELQMKNDAYRLYKDSEGSENLYRYLINRHYKEKDVIDKTSSFYYKLEMAYYYLKYYETRHVFSRIYARFKRNKTNGSQIENSMSAQKETAKELYETIKPYIKSIDELSIKLEQFNKDHENIFFLDLLINDIE